MLVSHVPLYFPYACVKKTLIKSDTPAKGGGLVNVTTSKVVGLNYLDL